MAPSSKTHAVRPRSPAPATPTRRKPAARRAVSVESAVNVILRRGEDGWIVAECPEIPGCISQGRTKAEALRNIREAIELCLESRAEEGWQLPEPGEVVQIAVAV